MESLTSSHLYSWISIGDDIIFISSKFCDVFTLLSNHDSGARGLNRSPLLPSGLCEAKCLQAGSLHPDFTSWAHSHLTHVLLKLSFSSSEIFYTTPFSPWLSPILFFKDYFNFHIPNISRLNFTFSLTLRKFLVRTIHFIVHSSAYFDIYVSFPPGK